MAKRWFGYVDPGRRGGVHTAGVAEFDTKTMTKEDRATLKQWEEPGGEDVAEELLDSVYPTKVYFAIDNLNSPKNVREKFSLNLLWTINWPIDCQNIYKSLKEAWEQIYINKKIVFKEIFEGEI